VTPDPRPLTLFEGYPDTLDEACTAFADRLERLFILGGNPEAMSVASIVRHFGANFPQNMVATPAPLAQGHLAHQPGDFHRYRTVCEVCGEPGTLRVSWDPERVPAETP
jgi:hypothetical protein